MAVGGIAVFHISTLDSLLSPTYLVHLQSTVYGHSPNHEALNQVTAHTLSFISKQPFFPTYDKTICLFLFIFLSDNLLHKLQNECSLLPIKNIILFFFFCNFYTNDFPKITLQYLKKQTKNQKKFDTISMHTVLYIYFLYIWTKPTEKKPPDWNVSFDALCAENGENGDRTQSYVKHANGCSLRF